VTGPLPPKAGEPPELGRPPVPKVPPPLSDPLQPTRLRPAVRTKIWTVVVRTNTSYRWRRNGINPSKRVPQAVPIGTRLRQRNRWLLWVANNANGEHRNLWRSSIFDLLSVLRGNGQPWSSVGFRYYDGSTQSPDCAKHLEKYGETGLTHLAGDASTGRRCLGSGGATTPSTPEFARFIAIIRNASGIRNTQSNENLNHNVRISKLGFCALPSIRSARTPSRYGRMSTECFPTKLSNCWSRHIRKYRFGSQDR